MKKTKLENICVSLTLAKQLKEAGYKQESLFYWCTQDNENWELKHYEELQFIVDDSEDGGWTWFEEAVSRGMCIEAPTATELIENLPHFISFYKRIYKNEITTHIEYFVTAKSENIGKYTSFNHEEGYERKLPDSLSKMWLYLKKEGLI